MITIFNRKELTITYSMEQQAKIRELLSAHKIDYYLKVVNRNRARTGSFGLNMAVAYEYIFFVQKKDYAWAQAILAGRC